MLPELYTIMVLGWEIINRPGIRMDPHNIKKGLLSFRVIDALKWWQVGTIAAIPWISRGQQQEL